MLVTLDKKPLAIESGLDDKSDPIHIAHPSHCVRHMRLEADDKYSNSFSLQEDQLLLALYKSYRPQRLPKIPMKSS